MLAERSVADITDGLEARKVPVGPVHTLDQVFASDQAQARGMSRELAKPNTENDGVRLIGNPLNFSRTPVTYRKAPPHFGEDTDEIMARYDSDE